VLIVEKDFKIEDAGNYFVLYFLKSKKELKEGVKNSEIIEDEESPKEIKDPKNPYKVQGYFTQIKNAFLAVYNWRKSKKYPFKEDVVEFTKNYLKYKKSYEKLEELERYLYDPIDILKKYVFEKYKYK
jgi:hypothetical protein